MKKNNLKVVNSKGDLTVAILCAISTTVIGGFLLYHANERGMYASGIMFIIMGMGYVISEFLLSIKVNDKSIKVRTYSGKKYEFACSEIDKISCEEISSAKRGIKQILKISAKGKTVRLRYEMDGIRELAEYFLEQRESGGIKKSVISPSTVRKLKQYIEWKTFEQERKDKRKKKRNKKDAIVVKKDSNCDAITLMRYSEENEVRSLFERVGGIGESNCYFTAHNDEALESLSAKVKVDDIYDGYLINRTEKGFAMIPLEHLKSSSVTPENLAILENKYYFIPNVNINLVRVNTNIYKDELCSVEIVLELNDRNIYLISTPEVEGLAYHYDNVIKFVDMYTI